MGEPSSVESIAALVSQARTDGVELWVEGNRLRFRTQSGSLSDALRDALRERRPEVIAHLRTEAASHIIEGPLAENQHGLWFLHQLAADSSAYHVAFVARVHGSLDPVIFEEAVQVLVDRHESLRTTYLSGERSPLRRVQGYHPFRLEQIDVSGWSREQIRDRLAADYARPFDLHTGPVIRVGLYRESADRHVLMIVAHHIAVDGTSMFVLLDELMGVHTALAAGSQIPARSDGATFDDFIQWQESAIATAETDRDYWAGVLTPPPPALDLPTTWPRKRSSSMQGQTVWQRLDPPLTAAIRARARSEGVTDYVMLLSLWFTLLHRLTGRTDITVGAPVQGRPSGRFARTVGDFVNTLPMRCREIEGSNFSEVVREVHRTVLDGFRHQDYPLPRMVHAAGGRSDTVGPPFQTLFVLQDFGRFESIQRIMLGTEEDRIPFGSLTLSPLRIDQQEGQFELSLDVWPSEEGLDCGWRFDSDLFDRQVVESWAGAFQALAAGIVADPQALIADLPLLRENDRAALTAWNATRRPYPSDATVHGLIEARAERSPESIAVVAADGTYSYAELLDRSRSIAATLRNRGVGPGDRVGVLVPRGRDMVAALLGVLGAGATYVPLDPSYPVARLQYMLEDSGAVALVTRSGVGFAADNLPPVVDLDADVVADPSPFTPGNAAIAAYVIYTSGSTGNPKGVVVSHRALVNFLTSMAAEPGLGAGDALLAVTTISFDIAGLELFLPLLVGARVVIADESDVVDGRRLARRMEEDAITVLQATPATWKLLIEAGWSGKADLRALCGGEALPESLADALLVRVGELWNLYGPTETTVWSTIERIRGGEPILVGRPIANTTVQVLDTRMRPVPIGVPGELWIGGAGLSDGYLGRPELTAQRFRIDPSAPDNRLYGTGDLVRFHPDGRLQHLGRLDHQVKVRGYRIELGEIEARLRASPDVADAVVVARDDHLVAYFTALQEGPTSAGLRRWLGEVLPDHMIPSFFVPLDALPLTPNGKVDRRALPDHGDVGGAERLFRTEPISPTEVALAEIWKSVLDVADPRLEDSFFELGGHSLLAARIVGEVGERFDIELPLVAVFNQPTLGDLAAEIDRLVLGFPADEHSLPSGFEAFSF